MKNIILTVSDNNHGDFLLHHWLGSLKDNVDLNNIDIVVLDLGLTRNQRKRLTDSKVHVFTAKKSDHIVNQRFCVAKMFLKGKKYDQVLFVDGGDIIFQEDISFLFRENRNMFRAVTLDLENLYIEWFTTENNFEKGIKNEIRSFLKNKPVINAGFILGPKDKFVHLCENVNDLVKRKTAYGPDQVIVNYVLYKEGVKLLDKKYNFMLSNVNDKFFVKNGTFYFSNGQKIPVVHNAGGKDFFRPTSNFGYGQKFNQIKYFTLYGKRSYFSLLGLAKHLYNRVLNAAIDH